MKSDPPFTMRWLSVALLALLAGCASLDPEKNLSDVQQLTQGRTGTAEAVLKRDPAEAQALVAELLKAPLSPDDAVRIALLNNPSLQSSLTALDISDAQRVQAARAPNPHFSIGRFTEEDTLEIERWLRFDVIGLLFLPWKAQWQSRQHELSKLQAAQEVILLATQTRKAWFNTVAAQQSVQYLGDVREAASAGVELARRMTRAGNFSRLQQAREELLLSDASAQLARARQTLVSQREQLTRLMGLWGAQTQYTLAPRLPDLPEQLGELKDVEARALRERLDVRSAIAESNYLADSLGLVKVTGYLDGMTLGVASNTTFDNAAGTQTSKRGLELELRLPLFDWGGARNARAESIYRQSAERVRDVAVMARSQAREAWHGWRTAYDLARHYRDEVVPLRQLINEEMVLRYNGMLSSVWDLLAEMRSQAQTVNSAIEAQRDFWLADTDLHTALTGTSPGTLTALNGGSAPPAADAQGH